jgi:ankyrin repeat protein
MYAAVQNNLAMVNYFVLKGKADLKRSIEMGDYIVTALGLTDGGATRKLIQRHLISQIDFGNMLKDTPLLEKVYHKFKTSHLRELSPEELRSAFDGFLSVHHHPDAERTSTGHTALMMAAMNGDVPLMSMLVDRGADIELENKAGENALDIATSFGDREFHSRGDDAVVWLLTYEPEFSKYELVDSKDANGNTQLHAAVNSLNRPNSLNSHSTEEIKRLLRMGANPNIQNNKGNTPMMDVFAGEWSSDVIRLLHFYGGILTLKNKDGTIAFDLTKHDFGSGVGSQGKKLRLNVMERETPDGTTMLGQMAKRGELSKLTKALEEDKINPNLKDANGQTAAHVAATAGEEEIMSVLIDAGANLSITDENGQTPLSIAHRLKEEAPGDMDRVAVYDIIAYALAEDRANAGSHYDRSKAYRLADDGVFSFEKVVSAEETLRADQPMYPSIRAPPPEYRFLAQATKTVMNLRLDSFFYYGQSGITTSSEWYKDLKAKLKPRTVPGTVMGMMKGSMPSFGTFTVGEDAWTGKGCGFGNLNSNTVKHASRKSLNKDALNDNQKCVASYLQHRYNALYPKEIQKFNDYLKRSVQNGYYGAWNVGEGITKLKDMIDLNGSFATFVDLAL